MDHAYASPEVLSGRPATPASDLYSAAALMAHLFRGAPTLPPTVADLDAGVAWLLGPVLTADPATRPSSAAGMVTALDQLAEQRHGSEWRLAAGLVGAVGAAGAVPVIVLATGGTASAVGAVAGAGGAAGLAGAAGAAGPRALPARSAGRARPGSGQARSGRARAGAGGAAGGAAALAGSGASGQVAAAGGVVAPQGGVLGGVAAPGAGAPAAAGGAASASVRPAPARGSSVVAVPKRPVTPRTRSAAGSPRVSRSRSAPSLPPGPWASPGPLPP